MRKPIEEGFGWMTTVGGLRKTVTVVAAGADARVLHRRGLHPAAKESAGGALLAR